MLPVGYVSSGALEADMARDFALTHRRVAHNLLAQGNRRDARAQLRQAISEWRRYRIIRNRAHADGYRWPHEREQANV